MEMLKKAKSWWIERKAHRRVEWLSRRYPTRASMLKELVTMAALKKDWETNGSREFPGMRTDLMAWVGSCSGLVAYFNARGVCKAGAVALPSLAADAVWHAWLRVDEAGFHRFCLARFGKLIPHETLAEMEAGGSNLEEALARCWAASCEIEKIKMLGAGIPSIFRLDGELSMPGGWAYKWDVEGQRLAHRDISKHSGRVIESKLYGHEGVSAAGLLMIGAISAETLSRWESSDKAAKNSGSSCGGSDCGGRSFASDNNGDSSSDSSSDSGSDSGSSCGSGCGGGD